MPNASETQIVSSTVKEAKNVFIFFGTAAIILLCWSDSLCLISGKKSGYTRPCTNGVTSSARRNRSCAFLDVTEPQLVYVSKPGLWIQPGIRGSNRTHLFCFLAQIWVTGRMPATNRTSVSSNFCWREKVEISRSWQIQNFRVLAFLLVRWSLKQRHRALEETEGAGGPKQFIYLLGFSVPQCLRGAKVLSSVHNTANPVASSSWRAFSR